MIFKQFNLNLKIANFAKNTNKKKNINNKQSTKFIK